MTEDVSKSEYRPVWENRRRVIFLSLIFSSAVILYVMFFGEDTKLNETIIQFSFIFGGSVVGSYVFGSTWEDVTKLRK